MRIMLTFYSHEEIGQEIGEDERKILFPIDTINIKKIEDLVNQIQIFIDKNDKNLRVEQLYYKEYRLENQFQVKSLLKDDDNIR